MKIPKEIAVVFDSREKRRLLFPDSLSWCPTNILQPLYLDDRRRRIIRITEVRRRLRCGDYMIDGHPQVVCVERKSGLGELTDNTCGYDRDRFSRALGRAIDECNRVIVFIDDAPGRFWRDVATHKIAASVLDRLFGTITGESVDVVWGGGKTSSPSSRRRVGEIILRRMLAEIFRGSEWTKHLTND